MIGEPVNVKIVEHVLSLDTRLVTFELGMLYSQLEFLANPCKQTHRAVAKCDAKSVRLRALFFRNQFF